jgi:hypothetical protein
MRSCLLLVALALAGCQERNVGTAPLTRTSVGAGSTDGDGGGAPEASSAGPPAAPVADLAGAPTAAPVETPSPGSPPVDAGVYADLGVPPAAVDAGADLSPAPAGDPAPPSSLGAMSTWLVGQDVLDVSVDQGGGVWAVTPGRVYYYARGAVHAYDQSSGLARGWATWTDTWFNPGTWPVTFASVAGGMAGEAVIGNIGAIADRLTVDPSTGAVLRLDNMQVTPANTTAAEYPYHLQRVVAALSVVADLNGTYQGTAYLGGFHGFYAFHGLEADCGCLAFEEHQHYITALIVGGADVRALALSADGDVWQGDRDFVTLLPQRSLGPTAGLFDATFTVGLDVFPGVRDEVWGLAVDGAGGVYVASYGNGLAYLSPVTHAPRFWSSASGLLTDQLTSVAVDAHGDAWVATATAGLARLRPASGAWSYYTTASGLPSNNVNRLYLDKLTGSNKLYVATGNGIAIISP